MDERKPFAYSLMESRTGGILSTAPDGVRFWWSNALIRENRERDERGEPLVAPLPINP